MDHFKKEEIIYIYIYIYIHTNFYTNYNAIACRTAGFTLLSLLSVSSRSTFF
jgi:hypothetical protein